MIYETLATGRVLLGVAALTAPRRFGSTVGVGDATPELRYLTQVYGARAIAMGTAYLTADEAERGRWRRLSLTIDLSDTVVGTVRLIRGDTSRRAAVAMVTLTAAYAIAGLSGLRA